MKQLLLVILSLSLIGCAASGPTYESKRNEIISLDEESARLVFFRTKESTLLIGRSAPVDIDGQKTGSCSYGGFFYRDILPGEYSIKTEIWDVPGKCELTLTAEAGEIYYFKVDPRSESFTAFMLGGVIGNAVESSGKKCGGAFKIYPASEEVAKEQMVGLKQSD